MKRELELIEIPGEHDARERTLGVLETAFSQREPVRRRPPLGRAAVAAAAVTAALVAALSPPGRAVLDDIRAAVGVERAKPALFSLPASGRLLVASDTGIWVVQQDGSKRLLGRYREASWSPFGRFLVAARENELAALEPDGNVRWTLARPGVHSPRWAGTQTDTRIAYVDRSGLRLVAGDGTGDQLVARGFRGLVSWRPGKAFVLATANERGIRLVDVTTGRVLWRRPGIGSPEGVAWSSDGERLLVWSHRRVVVYSASGSRLYVLGPGASEVRGAALSPAGDELVFAQRSTAGTQVWVVPRVRPDASAARRLFAGVGLVTPEVWSPDARWIVATWPEADQWVFLRSDGSGIRAAANVAEQFRSRSFPRLEGWCCAP